MAVASGAIRLIRPVRTARSDLDERVDAGARSWSRRRATQSTPGGQVVDELGPARRRPSGSGGRRRWRAGRPSGHGTRRSRGRAHRRRRPRPSAASGRRRRPAARSRAWRRAPWRSPAAASIAARSPETTTWPGEFRFATPKTPCADARSTSSGSAGVVEADDRGHAPVAARPEACISRPRSRTSRTPSASERALAATSAEYWPIEWPAENAGPAASTPSSAQRARTAAR